MKIQQEPNFQPITIILENREEAVDLWKLLRMAETNIINEDAKKLKQFSKTISDWFTKEAHL